MAYSVVMVDPQDQLEREIADGRMTRKDVALTYAFALRTPDEVDWPAVNRVIIDRWSLSALKWIKTEAWRLVEGRAVEATPALPGRRVSE